MAIDRSACHLMKIHPTIQHAKHINYTGKKYDNPFQLYSILSRSIGSWAWSPLDAAKVPDPEAVPHYYCHL
jgi:hypothetical protein